MTCPEPERKPALPTPVIWEREMFNLCRSGKGAELPLIRAPRNVAEIPTAGSGTLSFNPELLRSLVISVVPPPATPPPTTPQGCWDRAWNEARWMRAKAYSSDLRHG